MIPTKYTMATYSGSSKLPSRRCNEILSLAYWLKAFCFQPKSYFALSPGDNFSGSMMTGFPPSPAINIYELTCMDQNGDMIKQVTISVQG